MFKRTLPVALLLFGSGLCALVYQIAWVREFRLVFGGTTAASGAVLGIFMAGLGAGNALFGRVADRQRVPLRLYAKLELGICLAVAISPWLTDFIRAMYIRLGGELTLGSTGATAVRLLLALLVLGLPTCLMGGTLPAAVRAITNPQDRGRRGAGLLYGLNTLGAVAGAGLCTFLLLEHLGTRTTLWAACGVNLLIAAIAFLLSRSQQAIDVSDSDMPVAEPDISSLDPAERPWPPAFVYFASAILGLAFFLMEMVWFRMLSPLLGGTTYSLGIVLVMALLGIGLGGVAYSFGYRRREPGPTAFAWTCALEAVAVIFPYALGDQLAVLAAIWSNRPHEGLGAFVVDWSLISAIVILPAALVSGWQFPLLIALLGRGRANVGRQAGLAFAANTIGAIAGLLAGGFGILTVLTAPGCWRLVAWLLAGLCVASVALSWRRRRSVLGLVASLSLCAATVWMLQFPGPSAVWRHSPIGAGRSRIPSGSHNDLQFWLNMKRRNILWETDGKEASVAVSLQDSLSFLVNGKSDGNSLLDMPTQVMLGVVGGVLHPHPESCLVVGLGTGESAGWAAAFPSVERVDVVEIEPAVLEMARLCATVNNDVLQHSKVHVIINDAREVLLTTPRRYDLILSEPSNLYRPGVPNLYTREFYEAVRTRLKPGGIFVQWLQTYEADPLAIRTVFSTLRSVFEHQEAWESLPDDLLLVCRNEPPKYDAGALRERLALPELRHVLQSTAQVQDLEGWLAHYVSGPQGLADFADHPQRAPVNTDDRNIVEYGYARSLGRGGFSGVELHRKARERGWYQPDITGGAIDWADVDSQYLARMALFNVAIPPSSSFSKAVQTQARAYQAYVAGHMEECLDTWDKQPRIARNAGELQILAAAAAFIGHHQSAKLLERLRATHPAEAQALEAISLARRGKTAAARKLLTTSLRELRSNPWMQEIVSRPLIATAEGVVKSEPTEARELYEPMSRPFALYRMEDHRRRIAYNIAAGLHDPVLMAEAISNYEPHVPWNVSFLKTRAEVYMKTQHPLAVQAQRDLRIFLRQVTRHTDGE